MNDKISVILVNYNGREYNDKCITSILDSSISRQLQIVIVDNASTDDSWKELEDKWGNDCRIHRIPLNDNYGFSRANNVGIQWSISQGIECFLLLNNDTEIKEDAIERMFIWQKSHPGIVIPKIRYADRKDILWCAGGNLTPIIRKPIQRGFNECDVGQYDKSGKSLLANGCAMLLTREIINRTGLLDERFFLYYEDTEYSLRAMKNDIDIWYCAEAVVYHKVNGSTKGNENPANAYYIARNWLLCSQQHLGGRRFLFYLYFLLNRLVWIVIWGVQGKWEMNHATIRGVKDFLNHKFGRYIHCQ